MKLVQEGKLSPDDAAELIEAFNDAPEEPVAEAEAGQATEGAAAGTKTEDPISKFIGSIEKIGKDVAKNVNWDDIAKQVRTGVNKGVEAIKHAAEEAKKGGGFSAFFGSAEVKRVELPLHVPEGKTLRIESRSGDVTVEGGFDIGSLTVDATFRSYNDEEAKKLADAYTPVLEESDHVIVFRQPESANMTADVVARVPKGTSVEVKLASGDVKVVDTFGPARVEGASGDVALKQVSGAVHVSQRSGDVKVEDSETTILDVDTKSGDIALSSVVGVIGIKTSSGNVKAKNVRPKSLTIEAVSGDVNADIASPVEGAVNITAVSGDIAVQVVDGSDCRVRLSTLRGSVSNKVDLQDLVNDEHLVTGRMGTGNGTLDLSVVTGSVSLALRDSSET